MPLLNRTTFSLYRRHGTEDVPPEEHRRMQRSGGAVPVAGIVVVLGLTDRWTTRLRPA